MYGGERCRPRPRRPAGACWLDARARLGDGRVAERRPDPQTHLEGTKHDPTPDADERTATVVLASEVEWQPLNLARGRDNVAFIEIDEGPYFVRPVAPSEAPSSLATPRAAGLQPDSGCSGLLRTVRW